MKTSLLVRPRTNGQPGEASNGKATPSSSRVPRTDEVEREDDREAPDERNPDNTKRETRDEERGEKKPLRRRATKTTPANKATDGWREWQGPRKRGKRNDERTG